jgi:ParB-like chromosome segregation protein Spo0J
MVMIKLPINQVKANPNNPRIIKDDKFKKLVQSIKEFPEMLELRPIVVNDDMIVLGGNMRLKACKEAGLDKVPVIKASNLTEEQQKEFIIKDNVGFGEWDWNDLANNWETEKLQEWGLDIPGFDADEIEPIEPSGYDTDLAWLLSVKCDNEVHAQKLYEKFIADGLDVKIVN